MQVIIEAKGLEKVQEILSTLRKKGEDTAPLMAELANHLYAISDESFEKEESPDGISWDPIQYRKDDKNPNKILRDSGDMQDSLMQQSSSDEAIVGLNVVSEDGFEYPLTHQFGTNNAWGRGITIKARPIFPIHKDGTIYEETIKELEEIAEDYIQEVLK
jgi:phage virion morphogenesis protein